MSVSLLMVDESQQIEPGSGWPSVTQRFKHIELEINTACDLTCFACDRMSDVTTSPNMTLEQVNLFVEESLSMNWEWERIRLLGGEPTLHPKFRDICEVIIRYRQFYPKVFLWVVSNGLGKLSQHREWLLSNSINLQVEGKTKGVTPLWFNNTRITPVDRNPDVGELAPCAMFGVYGCGIGLTRHGYFLDGAGASVARVAGHDIGVMTLKELTWQAMLEQAKVLCRVCGHWNPAEGDLVTRNVTVTGEVTGKFWTETLTRYKIQKPVLRIYGEDK